MRFHLFDWIGSLVHLSCHLMGNLSARIYQQVQQRRILSPALPIPTSISTSTPISVPISVSTSTSILTPIPAPTLTADLSPTEVEMLAVSEAVSETLCSRLPDWVEEPQPGLAAVVDVEAVGSETAPDLDPDPAAALDRSQVVLTLLDEAYSIGHTTYPALIAYVQKHTGTGCSRRMVAAWKKTRKLIPAKGRAA